MRVVIVLGSVGRRGEWGLQQTCRMLSLITFLIRTETRPAWNGWGETFVEKLGPGADDVLDKKALVASSPDRLFIQGVCTVFGRLVCNQMD